MFQGFYHVYAPSRLQGKVSQFLSSLLAASVLFASSFAALPGAYAANNTGIINPYLSQTATSADEWNPYTSRIEISQAYGADQNNYNTYSTPATPQYNNQYNNQPAQYNNNYNQNYGQNNGQQLAPLQGYVASAPAGTVLSATNAVHISSEYSHVGDRISATLGSPIYAGSGVLVPAGSQLDGQVVFVQPAQRGNRNGQIELRFTAARTPSGQTIPLSAKIKTEDGTGVIKGGSTKGAVGRAAVKTGVGAGLGAALGTAMGPLSGGSVGRGAIYGTAVGAGAGLLAAMASKGNEAVLPAGEPVDIVLDQALSASPAQGNYGGANYQQQQQPSYGQPYNQPYGY